MDPAQVYESGGLIQEPSSFTFTPEAEGEDGGDGLGQPHHDRQLHLAPLRDRAAGHPVREASTGACLAIHRTRHVPVLSSFFFDE